MSDKSFHFLVEGMARDHHERHSGSVRWDDLPALSRSSLVYQMQGVAKAVPQFGWRLAPALPLQVEKAVTGQIGLHDYGTKDRAMNIRQHIEANGLRSMMTKKGLVAHIYEVNGPGKYPIVGQVPSIDGESWWPLAWTEDGAANNGDDGWTLLPSPPRKVQSVLYAVYLSDGGLHNVYEDPDRAARSVGGIVGAYVVTMKGEREVGWR